MDSVPSQFVLPGNSIASSIDGGRGDVASTGNGGRLTGAAPQPRKPQLVLTLCGACGSDQIQSTAWVVHNTGEIVQSEGPTDDVWCPDCDAECTYNTAYDYGFGFDLHIAGEQRRSHAGYIEALADARRVGKSFEIVSRTNTVDEVAK